MDWGNNATLPKDEETSTELDKILAGVRGAMAEREDMNKKTQRQIETLSEANQEAQRMTIREGQFTPEQMAEIRKKFQGGE